METKISAQLFTVRKQMKDYDSISTTFSKLKDIGYSNIEVARVKFSLDEAHYIKKQCDRLNITIGSTQIKYKKILSDFRNIVKIHKLWNCKYLGVSVLPFQYSIKGKKGLIEFSKKLNILGKRLNKHGIHLLYHHHDMEFVKYDSKTGLDIVMDNTNPNYVNLMMDTYWTQKGGKDPVTQIDKYKDRIKVVHLRDYVIEPCKIKGLYKVSDTALGNGNLAISEIVKKAQCFNIPFLAVEHNTKKPFEYLSISKNYINNI